MSALEPLALSPEKAAESLGLSVRQIYRLLADKSIAGRRSGSRTLIDGDSLRKYYASCPAYVAGRSMPNAPQVQTGRKHQGRRTRATGGGNG